jgi:hypothetical protein
VVIAAAVERRLRVQTSCPQLGFCRQYYYYL